MQREKLAGTFPHRDLEGIRQPQHAARLRAFRGPHLSQHGMRIEYTFEQHFDLAAAVLDPEKTRLQHPGIVEHQQIASLELCFDVGKHPVMQTISGQMQQA